MTPAGVSESVIVIEEESFHSAKSKELDSWKENGFFEEVVDNSQCISAK